MAAPMRSAWADVDAVIAEHADAALDYLARFVSVPSTVGNESAAQQVVSDEAGPAGLDVEHLAG